MLRKVQLSLVVGMSLLAMSQRPVSGATVLFTDRATWEAAVGSFSTEDFNSILVDTGFEGTTLAFPDLTLASSGTASNGGVLVDLPSYESNPGSADIDGTARVNLNGLLNGSLVSIVFDSAVRAMGFDTANYDIHNDQIEAFIGSMLIGTFPPTNGDVGFIGVLDTTGLFTQVDFRIASGNADTYNAFDNVSFATAATTSVPEPTSMALFGLTALGMGVVVRRRKRNGGPIDQTQAT